MRRPVALPLEHGRPVDTPPDGHTLLTALTTEHFTLQGARTATISESAARSTLFVSALSSALVALGFLRHGRGFDVVSLTVLPACYLLGVFTFVRLVDIAIEDDVYGRAINRIRHHYRELAGSHAHLFLLGGYDDTAGVLANIGLRRRVRWRPLFAAASMVAVLNALVGGAAVAQALSVGADSSFAPAVGVGAAAGSIGLGLSMRYLAGRFRQIDDELEVLFPSPQPAEALEVRGQASPASVERRHAPQGG